MKKLGFTLAEVLITLAILGVVAALTIPTLMADSRYQLISSRLTKFMSTTEDAALAYAAMNSTINAGSFDNIILYKDRSGTEGAYTYRLKDNTSLTIGTSEDSTLLPTEFNNPEKYGNVVCTLAFQPNVNGLTTVQDTYNFVLTDKGFVVPNNNDDCLMELFKPKDSNGGEKNAWKMTKTLAGGTCKKTSTPSPEPEG